MTLAVILALAVGAYAEGATVVFLFRLSECMETFAARLARRALTSLSRQPQMACRHPSGLSVPPGEVAVGELLQVGSGSSVAVDGVVLEACSLVDESSLTGESAPVPKAAADALSSGPINCGTGGLVMQAVRSASDSAAAQLQSLME